MSKEIKISIVSIVGRETDLMTPHQVNALRGQSFQEFEWVVVDDHYERNKDWLVWQVKNAFPLTHISPQHVVDYFAPGAAFNDGFVHSRGQIVYFMADYVMPHKDALVRHWDLHQRFPNHMVSGRALDVDFPIEELASQKSFQGSDYRMGLFVNHLFQWDFIEQGLYSAYRDGAQNFWTSKNESAPLDAILAVNGVDEQFDGGYGYHDDDLAQRLMTYGCGYLIDLVSSCLVFKHPSGAKAKLRDQAEQQKFKDVLIKQRVRDGIYKVNPHRNLIEERNTWKQSA